MSEYTISNLPEQPRKALEQVLRCFSNAGGLAGLFVTGSHARGLEGPDDLDLIAVWDHHVSSEQLGRLIETCRGGRVHDPDTDRFHLHGVVPEFHFMAGKDYVSRMITNFCWMGELPPESDNDRAEGLLASLYDALPVYDPEALAYQWQKTLSEEYPRNYQLQNVREQFTTACRKLAHMNRCGQRYDIFYWTQVRLEFIEHIVKALVSLNRRFYWGPKWMSDQIERLPLKPQNIWQRVAAIIESGSAAAENEMRHLAFSTGKIIAATLNDVDLEFSLKIIRNLRKQ